MSPCCLMPRVLRIICMISSELNDLKPQMIIHLSSGQYMRLDIPFEVNIQVESDSCPFNIWRRIWGP